MHKACAICEADGVLSSEFPHPFGKYTLLATLGRGGMGEVFAATTSSVLGIEKRCVIKTLPAGLLQDRESVARFLDEARLAVRLNQRNICSVFDVGVVDGQYYLAMDLIRGRDTRTIAQQLADLRTPMEPALALHIVAEVLDGLQHAHELADEAGQHLAVVHRDVSPQNIMVSFDGDVKLIDFGLAASTMKVERTEVNIVMGKMAYMAPEQTRGEKADARADLFSAAVVLYELLTGARYYGQGGAAVQPDVVASGRHVPVRMASLDRELQTILRRALAADREQRTSSASQFAEELRAHGARHSLRGDAGALRRMMRDLFGAPRDAWESAVVPTTVPTTVPTSVPTSAAIGWSTRPQPVRLLTVEHTEVGPSPDTDIQGAEGIHDDTSLQDEDEQTSTTRVLLALPASTPSRPHKSWRPLAAVIGVGVVMVVVVAMASVVGLSADDASVSATPLLSASSLDAGVLDAGADATVLSSALAAEPMPGTVTASTTIAAEAATPTAAPAAAPLAALAGGGTAKSAGLQQGAARGAPSAPVTSAAMPEGDPAGRREAVRVKTAVAPAAAAAAAAATAREGVDQALARLEAIAADGAPLAQLKVIREVCGPTACEGAAMNGSIGQRVQQCVEDCRAVLRRRLHN
jgi:serine/threonine protein kinase